MSLTAFGPCVPNARSAPPAAATPVSSLPLLLFPPLQLAADSLPNPPENEDNFRVCRRVETAKEGAFAFSALKASDGTVYKAVGGDPKCVC